MTCSERGWTSLNHLRDRGQVGRSEGIPTGSYTTAVTSREVRDLADLGNASRWLGERWERVGGAATLALIGSELRSPSNERYRCRAVLRLDEDEALVREVAARGLKSPDCILAGYDRLGRLVLQPCDFKFTLDVVTRDQVDPAVIRSLVQQGGPRLATALASLLIEAEAAAPLADTDQWLLKALDAGRARLLTGFFLAPDEPANRHHLRQPPRWRNVGLTEADVHLVAVEPTTFFDGLPGAELASLLRQLDAPTSQNADFSAATYYFQLGAAIAGALRILHRPLLTLLGPEPELDTVARLRLIMANLPPTWAIDLVRELAGPALERRERLRLAQRLAGSPMRGRLAYETVEAAGWQISDEPGPRRLTKLALKELLAQVEGYHATALAEHLGDRLASGPFGDDAAFLDWLRQVRPELLEHDRQELLARLSQLASDQ